MIDLRNRFKVFSANFYWRQVINALTSAALTYTLAASAQSAERLGSYPVDPKQVSVAGISSGTFMANQMHVAHSADIMGAAMIAGGLYGCAVEAVEDDGVRALASQAVSDCMSLPSNLNEPSAYADRAKEFAARGWIDPTSHLAKSRIYFFTPPAKTEQTEPAESREPGAPTPRIETSDPSADRAVQPFDLARLPPIESIDALTDIRAFLAPGIPAELTGAALRRAWLSDPAIRDFVGLAENQWDFTNPDTVPGFGSLKLTPELRRLVAGLFGESSAKNADASETTPAAQAIATTSMKTLRSNAPTTSAPDSASVGAAIVTPAPCSDAAPQNNCAAEQRERVQALSN